jgi:hypothetical protein
MGGFREVSVLFLICFQSWPARQSTPARSLAVLVSGYAVIRLGTAGKIPRDSANPITQGIGVVQEAPYQKSPDLVHEATSF